MPTPRKRLISPDVTPYYHCVSRCVRRAYLCGFDIFTKKSYEHRRKWIENRIFFLSRVFAIDICAYAVMSNHTHLVLHINATESKNWSDKEVCLRWHKLYKGCELSQKFANGKELLPLEKDQLKIKLERWRTQLRNISWFMRALNEPIARKANREDGCTGKFWEGRFKSQALLDEKALLACMVYVDLNPVRAGIEKEVKSSKFTSIRQRYNCHKRYQLNEQPNTLMHFSTVLEKDRSNAMPFQLVDYLDLINWTEKNIQNDIKKKISPSLLIKFNIDINKWFLLTTQLEFHFNNFIGSYKSFKLAKIKLGLGRAVGISKCIWLLQ